MTWPSSDGSGIQMATRSASSTGKWSRCTGTFCAGSSPSSGSGLTRRSWTTLTATNSTTAAPSCKLSNARTMRTTSVGALARRAHVSVGPPGTSASKSGPLVPSRMAKPSISACTSRRRLLPPWFASGSASCTPTTFWCRRATRRRKCTSGTRTRTSMGWILGRATIGPILSRILRRMILNLMTITRPP
ncbi:hypothetical protein BCR44DRAFT_1424551 [Catenaria anguillulae PL171]|uniref:Uncharacterized protein n=1 Tax=Catenaria anguillulae PL171 TaxID=765915 RepID=A0A1Y2I2I0_9FUNG|nr:hypothetical protein BCR44DRAFT_1424551 [Catenaria anguillulae PL171]